jgi:hypothetical protein
MSTDTEKNAWLLGALADAYEGLALLDEHAQTPDGPLTPRVTISCGGEP